MAGVKKSDIQVVPDYGRNYTNLASDEDLVPQLGLVGITWFVSNLDQLEKIGTRIYAQGKWTVPQIIEHLIDAERIFQYRALRFARQDKTELSGFDENMYVAVSKANDRSIQKLLSEYSAVRRSTVELFDTFDKDQLFFTGKANGQETSVIALGFMIIGHQIHHCNVIEERYFPLLA